MTISSTTTKNTYSGNGSTVAFAYGFKIFSSSDIKVYIRSSAGVETLKSEGTGSANYGISGVGETSGGTVTFVTAPASGESVVLIRDTSQVQNTDYVENDPFSSTDHENALDRLTMISQEMQEEMDRSFKISKTSTITTPEFTDDAATRASKLLGFSSDGNTLEATTGRVSSVSVSNVATSSGSPGTATASFTTASGALALGIPIGQTGMAGGVSMQYSTTTADADPGAGFIRLNNASLNSATVMYVDDSDGTTDISAWVQSWDDAGGANRGIVTIVGNPNTTSSIVTYKVTGAVTDASGYTKIPVAYLAGSTSISNNTEISLQFSPAGSAGIPGGLGLKYSTTTTDSDPGAGYIRFNNGTLSSASIAYIDDADLAGADISGLVQSWDDSTSTSLRGTITMVKETNAAIWAQWNITGAATDASGYTKQALTYVSGTGSFSNDDLVRLSFSRAGNLGATGATGSTGNVGGILMTFETATSDSDQGAGKVWLNHGTASSATVVYMDDVEAGGASINSLVDSWDDSTTTALRGTLSIYQNAAPANFHIFNVTGAVTSASTYSKVATTHVVSSGTISDGDAVSVQFVRSGNIGATGSTGSIGAAADGSAGSPTFTFTSDSDTGIFRPGANQLGMAAGGNEIAQFNADGISLGDNKKAQFGAGNDLQIYHDASHSYVTDNGTGNLKIGSGNQVDILGTSETLATFVDDGAVSLYHNDGVKIATTATGVSITGTLLATTDTDTSNTGSITLDFAANQNFVLTFTGNVTLANPSTEQVGQAGVIVCIQDGTGSRTLSLGSQFKTAADAGITLSTAANAVDIIPYFVSAADSILIGAVQLALSGA